MFNTIPISSFMIGLFDQCHFKLVHRARFVSTVYNMNYNTLTFVHISTSITATVCPTRWRRRNIK